MKVFCADYYNTIPRGTPRPTNGYTKGTCFYHRRAQQPYGTHPTTLLLVILLSANQNLQFSILRVSMLHITSNLKNLVRSFRVPPTIWESVFANTMDESSRDVHLRAIEMIGDLFTLFMASQMVVKGNAWPVSLRPDSNKLFFVAMIALGESNWQGPLLLNGEGHQISPM